MSDRPGTSQRGETGYSESISRLCSLAQVLCVPNDTILFSMKVRDLGYGASPIPNLVGKLEQITYLAEPRLFLTIIEIGKAILNPL